MSSGHLAEVKDMCLREYSEEEIKEMFKKEGHEEGIKEGIEENRISSVFNMVQELNITPERAMDILKIPAEDRKRIEEGVKALSENN